MGDQSANHGHQDPQLRIRSREFACMNCKKQYVTARHLETHQLRSCARTKRGLSELLKETKDFWEGRKRRRLEEQPGSPVLLRLTPTDASEEQLRDEAQVSALECFTSVEAYDLPLQGPGSSSVLSVPLPTLPTPPPVVESPPTAAEAAVSRSDKLFLHVRHADQ